MKHDANAARQAGERVHSGTTEEVPAPLNGKPHGAIQKPSTIVPVRLSLDDICNPPREEYVLGTMIPFAKSSVLFGPTSVGKSALVAQIAFAFAAGLETLWGLPLHPGGGPVLVYSAEDSLDDWKRKGAALLHAGGIDMEHALERFHVVDQSEGVARLSEIVSERIGSITRRITQPTVEQDRLVQAACEVGARLVIVETASRLVDDEDNASFSALQSALGHIGRETGAAVLVSHHATKAASKDNDSSVESVRGGYALGANARNVLSLFPVESSPDQDRFVPEDIVILAQGKGTSSTRRQAPITLVRVGTPYGAVFRLPDDIAWSPEEDEAHNRRLEEQRQREAEQLARLYDVVAKYLPTRPAISPSWLRDNHHTEIGVAKNGEQGVEALVNRAIEVGVLTVLTRNKKGITVGLGIDPRKRKPVEGNTQ